VSVALDIIAHELTKALAAERECRESVLEFAKSVAYTSVRLDPGDYPLRELREATLSYSAAVSRREQVEAALKELTQEGPYR
jgi:hypothetical protein